MPEAVRWNIKVAKETDLTLRTYLGAQGAKKGDLSKFIEEAVRWRVFHCTIQDIRDRSADTDPTELQRIIDAAVTEVRKEAQHVELKVFGTNIERGGAHGQARDGMSRG